jgi:hypothetical protein
MHAVVNSQKQFKKRKYVTDYCDDSYNAAATGVAP